MTPAATWRDFADGRRCEKLLWNRLHRPGELSGAPILQFDQRGEILALCRRWFPDGIQIPEGLEAAEAATRAALPSGRTLYEPRLVEAGCDASASVLAAQPGGHYDVILATDAMNLRDAHLAEATLAWSVFTAAGCSLRRARVLLLHRDYQSGDTIDPALLFRSQDVTSTVVARQRDVESVARRRAFLRDHAEEPERSTGPWCQHPAACPMHDHCIPPRPEHSVFTLHRGRRTAEDLLARGIHTLKEVPDSWPLSETQRIQVRAVKSGIPWSDREAIRAFLSEVRFPLHFVDFEACQTAVPFVPGTRPYQVMVFQFSLHRLKDEKSEPETAEHLGDWHPETPDPRPAFLEALKAALSGAATIGVFNAGFETSRLRELADAFPEHQGWIREALPKIIDFWDPFRFFHYYHPDQGGRTGIKTLLPLVSGQSYGDLDIGDGHTASIAWLEAHLGGAPEAQKQKIRQDLVRYCRMDTEALVALYRFLSNIAQEETRTPTVLLPPAPQAGVSTNSTTWATSG